MPAPEGVELSFPEDGGCFGCSPTNDTGLQLRFRRQGTRVFSAYRIADRFHGAPGIAHGGIVAAILDELSCAAAVFVADQFVVTGELVIRYERPVPVDVPLELEAEITAVIRRGDARLARSTGKFFYQERRSQP